MKIFLSWSGTRSQKAATAFHWWLSDIVQSLDPWMSSEDIESGTGWNHEIRTALQESDYGLIFVTRSNLNKPWLLFEAGALAKHVKDSRAIPLIVDEELELNMLQGPFSQLQARKFSKESVLKLVNEMNGHVSRPAKELRRLFEVHWPILEKAVADIPKEEGKLPEVKPEDQLAQILAILKSSKEINHDYSRKTDKYENEFVMSLGRLNLAADKLGLSEVDLDLCRRYLMKLFDRRKEKTDIVTSGDRLLVLYWTGELDEVPGDS